MYVFEIRRVWKVDGTLSDSFWLFYDVGQCLQDEKPLKLENYFSIIKTVNIHNILVYSFNQVVNESGQWKVIIPKIVVVVDESFVV